MFRNGRPSLMAREEHFAFGNGLGPCDGRRNRVSLNVPLNKPLAPGYVFRGALFFQGKQHY